MNKKVKDTKLKAIRGRPVTGKALTSTERGKRMEAALISAGGRVLQRMRLSPEATAALVSLSEQHGADRAAIEWALIISAKDNNAKD